MWRALFFFTLVVDQFRCILDSAGYYGNCHWLLLQVWLNKIKHYPTRIGVSYYSHFMDLCHETDKAMNEFLGNIHIDTYLGTFFLQHKQAASMVTNDTLAINEIKIIKKSPFSIIASDIQVINPFLLYSSIRRCCCWLLLHFCANHPSIHSN